MNGSDLINLGTYLPSSVEPLSISVSYTLKLSNKIFFKEKGYYILGVGSL